MEDEIDLGENRTVFTRSHADIKANGKTMCVEHRWKKLNENEIYCKDCPTVLVVGIDDERIILADS